MAQIKQVPKIELQVVLILNEIEARAVADLGSYGIDEFVQVFYQHLGKCYMEKNEAGLRTFLETTRILIPPILSKLDHAKNIFKS